MMKKDQKGATLPEYVLLLGLLFLAVLSGLSFLNDSLYNLAFRVDEESNLRNQALQSQNFVLDNEYENEYYTWVQLNNLNEFTAWDEFIENNYLSEYDIWLSERSGFEQAPDGLITDLSVAYGSGQATLTWTPVLSPNGRQVRGFHVYVDGIKNTTVPPVATLSGSSTVSHTVTGLSPSTTYRFSVRPYNNFGIGPESNVIEGTLSGTENFAPSEPLNVTANSNSGSVTLSWDEPSDGNGEQAGTGTIVQYEITASPSNFVENNPVRLVPYSGTTTTYTFDGLTNDKVFTFTIKALNSPADGSVFGNSASIASQPLEPYNVDNLALGLIAENFQNNETSNPSSFETEKLIDGTNTNFVVSETSYYRVFYKGLWRKFTSNTVDYIIRARLADGTLIGKQYGTLSSINNQQDEYIEFESVVPIPFGNQSIYFTIETETGSGNLQNIQNTLTPSFWFVQDVSEGEALTIIPTSQTLSDLPKGILEYSEYEDNNGYQTLTTTQGNVNLPNTAITFTLNESGTIKYRYHGKWKSTSVSNLVLEAYLNGNFVGLINQQNLDINETTIEGTVIIPSVPTGTHTLEIKAQTFDSNSLYESSSETPTLVYVEEISGSDPTIAETQIDITELPHGIKDYQTNTTGYALQTHTGTNIVNNTLSFNNNSPGDSRVYLINVSLVAQGSEGDSIVVNVSVNNGSAVRVIQDYFSSSQPQNFAGSYLIEIPSGTNITTVEFELETTTDIIVLGGSNNPIISSVIDIGN